MFKVNSILAGSFSETPYVPIKFDSVGPEKEKRVSKRIAIMGDWMICFIVYVCFY